MISLVQPLGHPLDVLGCVDVVNPPLQWHRLDRAARGPAIGIESCGSQKGFLPELEFCNMELDLRPAADIEPLSKSLRPAAIFLGLGVFLLGAIVLGAALAADGTSRLLAYTGTLLMLLGVSLIGGALVMDPSDFWLDPEIELEGPGRYLVVALSVLCLLFAAVAMFAG